MNSRRRIKPFSYPGQAFFIAAYLAAKLSAYPQVIRAYNWSNKVERWMEFYQLGYTV